MIIRTTIDPDWIFQLFSRAPNNPIPLGSQLTKMEFDYKGEKPILRAYFMNFEPSVLEKYKGQQIVEFDTNWLVELNARKLEPKEIKEDETTNEQTEHSKK